MNCNCSELNILVSVEDCPKGYIDTLITISEGNWVELMQCPTCKQFWRVDAWGKYQTQFALKIEEIEDWEKIDSASLQKEFLLVSRGGKMEEECAWENCSKERVKGIAYCIDHLYETGARK